MGIFSNIKNLFKNNTNIEDEKAQIDDVLLKALLNGETITREKALTIPAVSSAVDFISGSIACMPIKLYRYKKGNVEEVENDSRTRLLNIDTGDTLDAFQFKKSMVEDYLLGKGGYAYIRKKRNDIKGIYYVEDGNVSVLKNSDPIFKYVKFLIGTREFKNYELVKLLRNTKDGAEGIGLVDEISKVLETAFSTLVYQLGLVKSGGNKKGFLQSENKLSKEDITELKKAWNNLYRTNENNVVVLNKGVKFQESSSTSVEMQLNDSKKTLNDDINSVFHIHSDFNLTFKEAIYPIVRAFETALNNTLLLENEKKNYFFEFDVKELIKANLKERYEAYGEAIKDGWKTINEVRKEENKNAIEGMDVLNLGLSAVLYDTQEKKYYTPNTDKTTSMNNNKNNSNGDIDNEGGESNEE